MTAISALTSTVPTQPTRTGSGSFFPFAASSLGRRLTARMSVLDPEPDGDGERSQCAVGLAELLRDRDAVERIADANRDADQAVELLGEARELRGPAGQHELADPEGSGLVLVEAQARDELAGERLEVDPCHADTGLAARAHVAVDELAIRDDQQHAARDLSRLRVRRLRQQLPVEHGLLERDRQCLLCAEADRVRELLGVVDARD